MDSDIEIVIVLDATDNNNSRMYYHISPVYFYKRIFFL
jgi:hypothetical protein